MFSCNSSLLLLLLLLGWLTHVLEYEHQLVALAGLKRTRVPSRIKEFLKDISKNVNLKRGEEFIFYNLKQIKAAVKNSSVHCSLIV